MLSIHTKILDIDSPMISQAALEIYIKSGMFERHKSKINSSYYNRSIKLAETLEKCKMKIHHYLHIIDKTHLEYTLV